MKPRTEDRSRKMQAPHQLIALISTGLIIQTQWVGLLISPRWAHCGTWSRAYRFGIDTALVFGVLATFTYGWWVLVFSDTALDARKEKPYRLVANLACVGMLAFMATAFLL